MYFMGNGTNKFITSLINLGFSGIRKSTVRQVALLSVIFKFQEYGLKKEKPFDLLYFLW